VAADGFPEYLAANLGASRANLTAFGRELRSAFGAERVTLTNSGSSANLAAAFALRELAGPNRHAIASGFTFPTTLSALLFAGFDVTLVDTEEGGFGIDPEAVRRALRPDTGVIAATHFLGFAADVQGIRYLTGKSREATKETADRSQSSSDDSPNPGMRDQRPGAPDALRPAALGAEAESSPAEAEAGRFSDQPAGKVIAAGPLLLQDACETMGLRVGGAPVSAAGDLTTWSFYHPHHLSSYGGGAVIANEEGTQRIVESIVHWGRACTCHADGLSCEAPEGIDHQFTYLRPGLNVAMSELNACFGRFQLATFAEQESQRLRNFDILFEALQGRAGVWTRGDASPFVFPIALARGDVRDVTARLAERGVETRSLMGGSVADQPAYRHVPTDGLARCRALAGRSFFVGIHQSLPEEDVRAVARILLEELP